MKLNSNKLAYVQIDIMFAGILFFLFLSMTFLISQNYFETSKNNDDLKLLKSSAKDICTSTRNSLITRFYELNNTILSDFINSNYISKKILYNTNDINYNIIFSNPISNITILNFGFPSPKSSLSHTYSCYISNTGDLTQILVEVWK